MRFDKVLALILWLSVLLAACTQTPVAVTPTVPAEPVTLRFATLRILEALPLYVAQEEGLYTKHGVAVEIIPVGSAPERDQLIAAERADGMISEVLTGLLYNKDSQQVQIVRYARTATADSHLFSILASKQSGITSVEGLKGVPVGISDGTVIAYINDRMLQKEGLTADEIETVSVPSLGDRLALLGSGELQAAVLPEPLTSLALMQGAVVVLDDSQYPEFSHSTITFRKPVLDANPEAVRAFLAALEEAVALINADPAKYQPTLVDLQIVPAPLQGNFAVPKFVTAGVPTQAQFADVLAWAKEKKLIEADIAYDNLITPAFLP